jgi:RNA polymerase sigma-70 factor (ECF subfamily)
MSILSFGKKASAVDEFETLLEAQLDGLYNVALRYTRNPAMAEDLVHDTAVRALRFRDRFEKGSNFKAWVYTILTNTFINRYRRQKRERQIMEGSSREDVEQQLRSDTSRDTASQPESSYLEQMLSDDVIAALDDLPDEFRSVVVLCDVEGLSYKQIADVVNCPVGTVMSRLFRARRLLKGKLSTVAKERGIIKGEVEMTQPNIQAHVSVSEMTSYRRRKHG